MSWQPGDVVWVAFPFVETANRKSRPAVVISSAAVGLNGALFWAAMITGAGKAAWPGDVAIDDLEAANLPIASIVRSAKIATLATSDAQLIGRLGEYVTARVLSFVAANLARPVG